MRPHQAAGFVNAGFASAGMSQLILGAVFPVGLIITILTGAELFTGDAMLAPVAAFIHKVSWAAVLNLWVWVYIGNLIGSLVWAYIMANGPYVSISATGTITASAFGVRAVQIAIAKVSYFGVAGMWSAFLKAIGCNWLVNLAVLLGICADDLIGKFFGIWFPIMAFVSSGLEHSIANMMFIPAGLLTMPFLTEAQIATLPRHCESHLGHHVDEQYHCRHPRQHRGRHDIRRSALLDRLPQGDPGAEVGQTSK